MSNSSSINSKITLHSLYSLCTRAHNLLSLALDSVDLEIQDRYLATAREVLKQMEDDIDIFDFMQFNIPEDALNLLDRLGGGNGDSGYDQEGEKSEMWDEGFDFGLYEDAGLNANGKKDGEVEKDESFNDSTHASSLQQDREEYKEQGNVLIIREKDSASLPNGIDREERQS